VQKRVGASGLLISRASIPTENSVVLTFLFSSINSHSFRFYVSPSPPYPNIPKYDTLFVTSVLLEWLSVHGLGPLRRLLMGVGSIIERIVDPEYDSINLPPDCPTRQQQGGDIWIYHSGARIGFSKFLLNKRQRNIRGETRVSTT